VPLGDAGSSEHLSGHDGQVLILAGENNGPSGAQFSDGTLYGKATGISEPPCQIAAWRINLHIIRWGTTVHKNSVMESIVDWYRDTPQWSEVLAASRSGGPSTERPSNPLWSIYGPLMGGKNDRGFVIGQIGQSLDGRVATTSGQSHYINGPAAILHLHRLRALVDAVVVGVGTVLADDPQLNVRLDSGPSPARVVIDPHGRMPANAKCLHDDGASRIIIHSHDQKGKYPYNKGVQYLSLPYSESGFDPATILTGLADLGFHRILVEGGAVTLSRFLAAACLDRLHVMVAPMIIGAGPIGISLPPIASLEAALRPQVTTFALPGGDILYDCALSDGDEHQ